MQQLLDRYDRIAATLSRQDWLLATLARLVFAAVLAVYFLNSGVTKLGDGPLGVLNPSAGAYIQIFPRAFANAGYDSTALGLFHHAIVIAGTSAEFLLPVLILMGLFTRLAALGMIGFVLLQSATDIIGHGQYDALGRWFDHIPDAAIMDQRALWLLLLITLLVKGAGPLSLDKLLLMLRR
ncbi:putative oxidoreductase [Sulfitobacter marinus]|uniref:Putative oxidoreductase n=1 Tax=Sulfitobacter marinus TaxID=394264 RepID=A0A1I6PJ76_9RHOB|nr:DoxX family protein [Sulfitobacter marinus]SFS40282.1 putative oxidoreductase [Sulfitobacter marinus]